MTKPIGDIEQFVSRKSYVTRPQEALVDARPHTHNGDAGLVCIGGGQFQHVGPTVDAEEIPNVALCIFDDRLFRMLGYGR